MADQKINELPTKTAPSTGDKMLMIGAAEEYQIDYDQLASAILDKLSTKQYSELDTTAKTVLGALDELNGNMFFEPGETFSLAYTVASAFLTSNGKTLYISIPCGKLLYNVSGFSFSGEGIYVRQNGNYLIGSSLKSGNFDDMQVLSRRVLKDSGTLLIVVYNDTGFPNSINNDVVSAYFDKGTITFE